MKPADLDTGASRLRVGFEHLLVAWAEVSEDWSDGVATEFFEKRIEPIGPIVKNSLDAIGRMRQLLHDAQRDLEE